MLPTRSGARVGYVLKMYPRLSETFVVSEVIAREAIGERIDIFSLRSPVDGRFHDSLATVNAEVTYLSHGHIRPVQLWDALRAADRALPRLAGALPALVEADVDVALQGVELALEATARGLGHLHAHFGSAATSVARIASLLTGIPYSFTAHAKDIYHASVDPADLQLKIDDAHHVVTVSEYNRAHLCRAYHVDGGKVRRVYNGVDLAAVTYTSPAHRPPLIAAVGRLVEKKGLDVLVDACALLRDAGQEFCCVIAGTGPLLEPLAARIADHALGDLVTLAGALPQHRVRELVGGAACLAAPCVRGSDGNQDGLPTVLLEAMALGTPCVSTDLSGIPEAVRHGDTGLLCPQRDPVSLAAALAALLTDPARRTRLAANARALVERDFDVRDQARALHALLDGVPEPAAAPAG